MNSNTNVEDLLRSLDPLTVEVDQQNAARCDSVWAAVVANAEPTRRRTRRRRVVGASSLVSVGAAVALIVGLLPGTPVMSAAAATLHRAAVADAGAAVLPSLGASEYYYQGAQVTMTCRFSAPTATGTDPWITYVSDGTMQSWTKANGDGKIVITPTPVNEGGSHFATPADEAKWVAEGKPFVPCALIDPSNQLIGNSANSDTTGSLGGYSTSVSGYGGLGVILGFAQNATPITVNGVPVSLTLATDPQSSSVTSLPTDVQRVAAMLANGEINTDGTVSNTPQVCPVDASANAAPGCNANQQMTLIQQLLQLPEASAKLGSVLYDILAQMPGATVTTNTTDSFGNTGSLVSVPLDGSSSNGVFQVLINPTTGALLSSAALASPTTPLGAATTAPESAVGYGPIAVVSGIGTLPSGSN